MNLIQDTIRSLLPAKRKTTMAGWDSFNAVCCHHRGESRDTKLRGGVRFPESGFVYHCFNCGFKAGWQPGKSLTNNTKSLFKYLGLSELDIGKLSLEVLKHKTDLPALQKFVNLQLHEVDPPEDCLPINEWAKAGCADQEFIKVVEYVLSRKLTLDDYPWHWSAANGWRDRVIIPFYHESKLVGYTGRKITDGKPKYLSSSQSGYVFNIDRQTNDRQFVIVTEGQFDAIAIDGVAIMTNEPNEAQCFRINNLARKVIVVPDHDKPGAKLLQAAIDNGWNISVPPWGDDVKDVAKAVEVYGKIYTMATILHYQESNKIRIELQKKKLEKINVQEK